MSKSMAHPKRTKLILIFLFLLIALPIAFLIAAIHVKKERLRDEIDRIRAAGLPTTWAEWNDYYPAVLNEDNAALYVMPVLNQINFGNRNSESLPVLGRAPKPPLDQPPTSETRAAVEELLVSNEDWFPELEAALEHESSRYPIDLNQGFKTLLPHLSKFKVSAELFQLKALLELDRGETEKAIHSVLISQRLAYTLKEEPILISYLVYTAMTRINIDSLEYIFSQSEMTRENLESVSKFATDNTARRMLERALSGERAFVLDLMENEDHLNAVANDLMEPISISGYRLPGNYWGLQYLGVLSGDFEHYVKVMGDAIESLRLHPEDPLRAAAFFPQDAEKDVGRLQILSAEMLPGLRKSLDRLAFHIARQHAFQTALAIENYRLDRAGKLPYDLEALVPKYLSEVPLDPYTGSELKYSLREPGYVVYSLGPDKIDQKGEMPPSAPSSNSFDVSFTVAR